MESYAGRGEACRSTHGTFVEGLLKHFPHSSNAGMLAVCPGCKILTVAWEAAGSSSSWQLRCLHQPSAVVLDTDAASIPWSSCNLLLTTFCHCAADSCQPYNFLCAHATNVTLRPAARALRLLSNEHLDFVLMYMLRVGQNRSHCIKPKLFTLSVSLLQLQLSL